MNTHDYSDYDRNGVTVCYTCDPLGKNNRHRPVVKEWLEGKTNWTNCEGESIPPNKENWYWFSMPNTKDKIFVDILIGGCPEDYVEDPSTIRKLKPNLFDLPSSPGIGYVFASSPEEARKIVEENY